MAEGFREWGDFNREEEWKRRSTIRKIFSFRAFKFLIKIICAALVIGVYAILAYRLATGLGIPDKAKEMIWNEAAYNAYSASGGDLTVYSQDPEATFGNDGRFSIYQMRYIPEIDQVQFTLRYNRSTVVALKDEIAAKYAVSENATAEERAAAEKAAADAIAMVDNDPFVFILRDQDGRVYDDYSYTSYSSGLYTYVRIAFDGVSFFNTKTAPAVRDFPTPSGDYSSYIYKGPCVADAISSDISYLYLDFYYEYDVQYDMASWADPLLVYRNGLELNEYDYSKHLPTGITNDLMHRSLK